MKSKSRKGEKMRTAVVEEEKLGELQNKLDALNADRLKLERQKAQQNDFLESIASRRPALTKTFAKGDETAGKRLDDLDTEERSVRRRLEGVDGHLSSNAAEIMPLEAEVAKESQLEAIRKRKESYEILKSKTLALLKEEERLEADLTRTHTKLHENLASMSQDFSDLDGSNDASKIYEATFFKLKRINAGWRPSPRIFGNGQTIEIRPMLPPR
jgi:hypothetical protein